MTDFCPNCFSVLKIANFCCDNDCKTCFCEKCMQPLWFSITHGSFLKEHDPLCGVDYEDEFFAPVLGATSDTESSVGYCSGCCLQAREEQRNDSRCVNAISPSDVTRVPSEQVVASSPISARHSSASCTAEPSVLKKSPFATFPFSQSTREIKREIKREMTCENTLFSPFSSGIDPASGLGLGSPCLSPPICTDRYPQEWYTQMLLLAEYRQNLPIGERCLYKTSQTWFDILCASKTKILNPDGWRSLPDPNFYWNVVPITHVEFETRYAQCTVVANK